MTDTDRLNEALKKLVLLIKQNSDMEAEIEAAEYSLDKCFDVPPSYNLATKASDVREMFCKMADENLKLKGILDGLKSIETSPDLNDEYDKGRAEGINQCIQIIKEHEAKEPKVTG